MKRAKVRRKNKIWIQNPRSRSKTVDKESERLTEKWTGERCKEPWAPMTNEIRLETPLQGTLVPTRALKGRYQRHSIAVGVNERQQQS